MSLYRVVFDQSRCIGCKSCLVHCTVKNSLPAGVSLNKVSMEGPFAGPKGLPRVEYGYQNCLHCDEPYCVKVCPSGALTKRKEDGMVFLDEATCIGCKLCVKACPWGVPVFMPELKKVKKCDYCWDRVEQGQEPACVTGCTAKALTFKRLS